MHPQVLFPVGGNPFGVIIGNDTPERRSSHCVLERMVMMERCILTMFIIRVLNADPIRFSGLTIFLRIKVPLLIEIQRERLVSSEATSSTKLQTIDAKYSSALSNGREIRILE